MNWNLENFHAHDAAKVARVAHAITQDFESPHILALQEICGDSSPLYGMQAPAAENARALIAAIKDAGGPIYRYLEIPPASNRDGGKPGVNIRCGFLYRVDRVGVTFPTVQDSNHPDDAEFAASPSGTRLKGRNPALIAPTDEAFKGSRKPLIAQFTDILTQEQYFIANLHLASDGFSLVPQPDAASTWQPNPARLKQRVKQAERIADFTSRLLASITAHGEQETHHVIVCGDFNTASHTSRDTVMPPVPKVLEIFDQCGLWNTNNALPMDAYSHRDSNLSMTIDHMYISPQLAARMGPISRPQLNGGDRTTRLSDHNPTVLTINAPLRAQALSHMQASVTATQR